LLPGLFSTLLFDIPQQDLACAMLWNWMGVKANRREKETNDVSNRVFPIFLVIVFFFTINSMWFWGDF
jgi:hypothetical protein